MRFRNVDVPEGSPLRTWPTEAIQAVLERGSLDLWRRLVAEINREPWGPVARAVEEAVHHSPPYGIGAVMEQVIDDARRNQVEFERRAVSALVASALKRSGLVREDFASHIGTSSSRLSTYLSGKVVPSSTMLLRMHRVARRRLAR